MNSCGDAGKIKSMTGTKKSKWKLLIPFVVLGLLAVYGCAGAKSATVPGAYPPEEHLSPELPAILIPAEHLVFIGLDGWGGAYVSKADMPAVKRMMANGASCLDMQCVMPSSSWPNWTSMFSGAPPEKRESENFPGMFTVVKKSGIGNTPVLFYEWDQLSEICPDGAVEKFRIASDPESAQRIAVYIAENKPFFTAVIFNEPDHTGLWGTKSYYAKLAEMDTLVAIIEQATMDAGIYSETVFVLSSDHGGLIWGHGGNTPRQRKIPLIIYGRGIKKKYEIPSLTSICDIAPTMAVIMGLEPSPEWTGRVLTEIFE